MQTKRIRTLASRRLLLTAVVIVAALIQSCTLPAVNLRICLLLPLTVIIAMFEKESAGLLYGILAGCLWDVSTATADGMKALFLAMTGCICGLLIRYIMRNNLLSALVLTGAASLLFFIGHWVLYVVPHGTGMWASLLRFYIPQILITLLMTVIIYFFIRAIEKKLRTTDEAR